MPVVIKYVVERNGVEKMTFSSKAEADQYDKLLDTAENLEDLLRESDVMQDEQALSQLAMYLAENKDELLSALGNKRKTTTKKASKTPTKPKSPAPLLDDLVIEPDADSYYDDETSVDYSTDESSEDFNADDMYSESDAA